MASQSLGPLPLFTRYFAYTQLQAPLELWKEEDNCLMRLVQMADRIS